MNFLKSRSFIFFLILCGNATEWMSMDIHLPSMPKMVHDLNTSEFMVQLIFMIGFIEATLTPILWGPLTDAYGRRPVLQYAIGLSLIGQFGCVIAPNIQLLLLSRMIQYLGVGGISTIGYAIVTDIYKPKEQARVLNIYNLSWMLSVIVAPIIGAFLCEWYGWRGAFVFIFSSQFIFLVTLLFLLPETIHHKTIFSWKKTVKNYHYLIKQPVLMYRALLIAFIPSTYMVFMAHAAFIYINMFDVSQRSYAYFQAVPMCIQLLWVLIMNQTMKKYGNNRLQELGISLFVVFIILLTLGVFGIISPSPWYFAFIMTVEGVGVTCLYSLSFTKITEFAPKIKATSLALTELLCGLVVGSIMVVTGWLFNDNYNVVMISMILSTIVIIGVWFGAIHYEHKADLEQKPKESLS